MTTIGVFKGDTRSLDNYSYTRKWGELLRLLGAQ